MRSCSQDNNLHHILKQKTRDLHDRTEQVVARIAPVETRDGYTAYLLSMQILNRSFQPILDRAASLVALAPISEQLDHALTEDLDTLGRADRDPSPSPHEPIQLNDMLACPSQCIGAAYVFEGSALGAAILYKRVRKIHGEDCPTLYFSTLARDRAKRWRHFSQRMETAAPDHAEALNAARRSFETVASVLLSLETEHA